MTKEEVKALYGWMSEHGFKNVNKNGKEIVLSALEKQIPQPVQWTSVRSWGKETKEPMCPVCESYVTRHEFFGDGRCITYCDRCGQAIGWREECGV